MKSLEELKKLREQAQSSIDLRVLKDGYRIVVGMATCGIAAGARPILAKFVEEVANRKLENVTVTQVGCIGECALEPIVEVYDKDNNRTTYGLVTVEDVNKIIDEHVLGGKVIETKTLEYIKANK